MNLKIKTIKIAQITTTKDTSSISTQQVIRFAKYERFDESGFLLCKNLKF